jgi:hypothetical protein
MEGSAVTQDLAPNGSRTLLTMTHLRFAGAGNRDGHPGGWSTILDGLVASWAQAAM